MMWRLNTFAHFKKQVLLLNGIVFLIVKMSNAEACWLHEMLLYYFVLMQTQNFVFTSK